MTRPRLVILMILVLSVTSCSGDTSPPPRSPDGTTPDGLWLMVMNNCERDCDEPGLGMGGRYYHVIQCEPIDEANLGQQIAIPDPESAITVQYDMARPIVGIEVEKAVAVGRKSPSACESRDLRGWFAVRSIDHIANDELAQQLASLAPSG